jgi:hypothetical protein
MAAIAIASTVTAAAITVSLVAAEAVGSVASTTATAATPGSHRARRCAEDQGRSD